MSTTTVLIDSHEVKLSNLDKVLYPAAGFTKAEVVDYYARIAPVMLPHIRRRPMTFKRYPNGVDGPFFFEKECPSYRPTWVPTAAVPSRRSGTITFCSIDDQATLVWAANLAALELHPLLAVASDLEHPVEMVFDLDPGAPAGLMETAEVALVLRDALASVDLDPRVKSSGSKGLHLSVALDGRASFDETKAFAHELARMVERQWPDRVVSSMRKTRREGRVLIDWSQNDRHKSTVAPYSLRAGSQPTIAAPLRWDEVEAAVADPDSPVLRISPAEALARVERFGDLFERPPKPLPGSAGSPASASMPAPAPAPASKPAPDPSPALQQYQSMRDFKATPEPAGAAAPEADAAADGRFVIQQHDATRLHWDLRLERDGVLASWAIPKGLPWSPNENHLAVHTEDHPQEYLDFHGEIPEGNYGAGSMTIWDSGTYTAHEFTDKKVVVDLHGNRVQGRYALFAVGGRDGRDWMIHRMDPPADPRRQPVPRDWRPMRATPGRLPEDEDEFAFELRWSGCRALLSASFGEVELHDSEGRDISAGFPEVRRIGRALGSTEVVLDGVIVETQGGRPAAPGPTLGRRVEGVSDSVLRRLARDHPVVFLAFDLLWRDGHPRIDEPYAERRTELEDLGLEGPAWQVPSAHHGDGAALLEAAAAQGLRGLVAKRLSSPYRPGATSPDWIRIDA